MKEEQDERDLNPNQELAEDFINRGGNLFGKIILHPKSYKCPNCGIILGPDILWKKEENIRKPYCSKCKGPVKEEENKMI